MDSLMSIDVNSILRSEVVKITSTLIPPGVHGNARTIGMIQSQLGKIIDVLGRMSSQAQGLHKVITSAEKFHNSYTHYIYLLVDPTANEGKGLVIGFLKVGQKHLYLSDKSNNVRELEAICILDFYVLGDRQRHGCGRRLFDYMLQDLKIAPHLLAIDGPSEKMINFMASNYGLQHYTRQSNNFAVVPAFFGASDAEIGKSGWTTPVITHPTGRFSARKPTSGIGNIIHGDDNSSYTGSNGTPEQEVTSAVAELSLGQPHTAALEVEVETAADVSAPDEGGAGAGAECERLERPRSLHVAVPGAPAAPSLAGSASSRRDTQLTDQGYFDVKFYHNKLW